MLLKGNQIINLKEDNGGRKAHVKFSLLITTSHTMGALPHRAQPEMCRSLSCFKLSPHTYSQPQATIIFVLIKTQTLGTEISTMLIFNFQRFADCFHYNLKGTLFQVPTLHAAHFVPEAEQRYCTNSLLQPKFRRLHAVVA